MLPLFISPRYYSCLDLARRSTEVATCISKADWTRRDVLIGRRSIGTGRVSLVTFVIRPSAQIQLEPSPFNKYTRLSSLKFKFAVGMSVRMTTNSRCQMFKNQLGLLLDKFEVCSKATAKRSIRELTFFFFFFAHRLFYADTSPTRGNRVAVYTLKSWDWHFVGSLTRLRLIHIPSLRIQISMKGLNFLIWEETNFIILFSASFFYRARDCIMNGGIFIRSNGNVAIRQTGE